MYVIGLTGGIASGKTTVAGMLAERGATVIDADLVGHEVYQPERPAWRVLIEAFGWGIVRDDRSIDRKQLGALVFGDPDAMRRLTAIVWPLMKDAMATRLARLREAGTRMVVLEAAVLLEAGWEDLVDEVWAVVVAPDVAIERVVRRSAITESEARARLAAQIGNEERAARADVVIDNSGSLEQLALRVDALWRQALQRAA